MNSICELKDKRLVSCGYDRLIVVYNHSHKVQFKIQIAHDKPIISLYALRNGDLASSSRDCLIKIWRINENDYKLIHTLQGHTGEVTKVIELESGRICSCSFDKTIRIWENYKCIKILNEHVGIVGSIIEMNNYIVYASNDNILRIWDESTYDFIKNIYDVYCYSWNGLLKLNDNTLLVGGENIVYIVDIGTSKVNKIIDKSLGIVRCLNILKNGLILFGNSKGEIIYYDSSSNKIILKQKFHSDQVTCLIKTEDNHLISSSADNTINVYK